MSGASPYSSNQQSINRCLGPSQQVARMVMNTTGQRVPVTINLPNQNASNQQLYYTQRPQGNRIVRGEAPNARLVGVVPPMRQPVAQQATYSRSDPSSSNSNSQQVFISQSPATSSSSVVLNVQPSQSTYNVQRQQPQQQVAMLRPQVSANQGMDEGVQRCHRFFSTLLALARKNTNGPRVAELVNQLFKGSISVEVFKEQLQSTLRSVAQPHLVPFLQSSLPTLRQLVQTNQVLIEGLNAPVRQQTDNNQMQQQTIYTTQTTTSSYVPVINSQQTTYTQNQMLPQQASQSNIVIQQGQRLLVRRPLQPQHTQGVTTSYVRQTQRSPAPQLISGQMPAPQQQVSVQMSLQPRPMPTTIQQQTSQRYQQPQQQQQQQQQADGVGVDLNEESRNMQQMGPSEEVLQHQLRRIPLTGGQNIGTLSQAIPNQIEEQVSILDRNGVLLLVGQMCREKLNNNRVKSSALSILGQAVRGKLIQMISQLRLIALHKSVRLTTLQNDQYVRERFRLLEKIERDQQTRDAEEERRELIKLASSKSGKKNTSTTDDDLKMRAKNLKTAEEEALRSAEANAAAFAALRTTGNQITSSQMRRDVKPNDGRLNATALWQSMRKPKSIHVFIRDIIIYLESDAHFDASSIAYRLRLTGKRSASSPAESSGPPPKRPNE